MNLFPSGHRIAGRYEVAGAPLLGGMGIVYLCFDHGEQRPVALKTFKPEYLPDRAARDRFLQEGETWIRLGNHPHIVRCYEVSLDSPRPGVYLALELIAKEEGRRDASLRSWLTSGRPLPVEQAFLITLQIVRGMKHASEVIPGFIHRDLKPENVLVGADRLSNAVINRVRVTDFGLVKGLQAKQVAALAAGDLATQPGRLTQVGAVVGTPAYMAPEQWAGPDVPVQADIYALGCILGEMVTGRPLVQGQTLDELRRAHQGGQALAAARAAPAALADLLNRCLATEPTQRYASWDAVELALAAAYQAATGQPTPGPEAASTLSRTERIAIGWSYDSMGGSCVDMDNAQAALAYFQRAHQAGRAEEERQLEAASLGNLGVAYLKLGNTRQAIGYCEQALAIAREISDRSGESANLDNLGSAYRELEDARQAIGYHEQALAITREISNRRGEGIALSHLGSAYQELGDARQAIGYHEQALAIARELGDRRGECSNLSNLGGICGQLGDTRRAIDYSEQALAIRRELRDRHGAGNDLGNLGSACCQLGAVQSAIDYFEQALVVNREMSDRHGEGATLSNLGSAYFRLEDTQQASSYYEQALAIRQEIGDLNGVAMTSLNMARLYGQQGDRQRALSLAREAGRLWSKMGHAAYARRAQQLVTQLENEG